MNIDEEVWSKLSKKTRERTIKASESLNERMALSSVGLTKALKGGFGRGRQTLVWGNKSAGKTSMLLQTIGKLQAQGQVCAWVDSEHSFDKEWAERLGVDCERLLLSDAKAIPDVISVGVDYLQAGIDFLAMDSISAMVPSGFFEKEDELKEGMEGARQIGQASKELGVMVNKFNYVNHRTALALISQARNDIQTYGAVPKPQGGMAVQFFSSTIVKLWSSASGNQQITMDVKSGNKLHTVSVGRPVNWTVEYNKLGPSNQIGKYDFYYDGPEVGVDSIGELVDMSEMYGIVNKGGAWYNYGDIKIQGRKGFVQWMKDNPDMAQEIQNKLTNEQN